MPHCGYPNILGKHDRIIAVMGTTGTGKSTFINLVTGDEKIAAGHGIESKTDSIDFSCFVDDGSRLSTMIVDTPGFDDSRPGHSDVDILTQIAEFLLGVREKKLNGIIYMHRISDPRTGGMAKRNLRMFRELCGEKTLTNVLIVTTNWSRVSTEEGDNREKELEDDFFKPLIDQGARMVRHDGSVNSALAIVAPLLQKDGVTTKIVDEMHRDHKELIKTSAGALLSTDLKAMEARYMAALRELKEEMKNAAWAKDEEWTRRLALERREFASKLDSLRKERVKLKRGILRKLLSLFLHHR